MSISALERFIMKTRGPKAVKTMVKEPDAMIQVEAANRLIDSGSEGLRVKDLKKMRKKNGQKAMTDILEQLRNKP